jgi:hypothetical protein
LEYAGFGSSLFAKTQASLNRAYRKRYRECQAATTAYSMRLIIFLVRHRTRKGKQKEKLAA